MRAPVIYFDLGNTLVNGPANNRQPFDDAVSTIEELWWRGYKIGLLSDQNPGTTEQDVRQKLDDYGLESYRFDVITISSEFNPPVYKPAAQIFEAAATKAGHATASNNTIFVTENLEHIEAARDLGWRAIHKPFGTDCTQASGECVPDLDELLMLFPQLDIDLYIRDAPGDTGDDLYTGGNFWNSPDMWIRNQQDSGLSHQNPKAGQDNWFYTRVHNRGTGMARMFYVGYNVKEWLGTQFVYPDDYMPYIANPFAIGNRIGANLDAGDSLIVHTKWSAADVPPTGTHACWLAAAQPLSGMDPPAAGAHVWEHNNLSQKNLVIVDLEPDETGEVAVVIGSRYIKEARYYTLELHRSKNAVKVPVAITGQSAMAMDKLVRAGRNFIRKPSSDFAPARYFGLRFVDGACVELMGVSGSDKEVMLSLESGSRLTWDDTINQKTAPSVNHAPNFMPASLVREKDGRASVEFANDAVSGLGIALRPWQVVRTTLRFMVPRDIRPGETFELDLAQRAENGLIVGGITIRANVSKHQSRSAAKPAKKTKTSSARRKAK